MIGVIDKIVVKCRAACGCQECKPQLTPAPTSCVLHKLLDYYLENPPSSEELELEPNKGSGG